MDKNVKHLKRYKILITLFVILLCGFFIFVFSMDNEIKRLDNEKNNALLVHNNMTDTVQNEVINYLNVTNSNTWKQASSSSNLSESAKLQIYGESFETFNLSNVTEYKIVDILYDITESENIIYSVDTFLKIKDKTINRNFLVTYSKETNLIELIEVY